MSTSFHTDYRDHYTKDADGLRPTDQQRRAIRTACEVVGASVRRQYDRDARDNGWPPHPRFGESGRCHYPGCSCVERIKAWADPDAEYRSWMTAIGSVPTKPVAAE